MAAESGTGRQDGLGSSSARAVADAIAPAGTRRYGVADLLPGDEADPSAGFLRSNPVATPSRPSHGAPAPKPRSHRSSSSSGSGGIDQMKLAISSLVQRACEPDFVPSQVLGLWVEQGPEVRALLQLSAAAVLGAPEDPTLPGPHSIRLTVLGETILQEHRGGNLTALPKELGYTKLAGLLKEPFAAPYFHTGILTGTTVPFVSWRPSGPNAQEERAPRRASGAVEETAAEESTADGGERRESPAVGGPRWTAIQSAAAAQQAAKHIRTAFAVSLVLHQEEGQQLAMGICASSHGGALNETTYVFSLLDPQPYCLDEVRRVVADDKVTKYWLGATRELCQGLGGGETAPLRNFVDLTTLHATLLGLQHPAAEPSGPPPPPPGATLTEIAASLSKRSRDAAASADAPQVGVAPPAWRQLPLPSSAARHLALRASGLLKVATDLITAIGRAGTCLAAGLTQQREEAGGGGSKSEAWAALRAGQEVHMAFGGQNGLELTLGPTAGRSVLSRLSTMETLEEFTQCLPGSMAVGLAQGRAGAVNQILSVTVDLGEEVWVNWLDGSRGRLGSCATVEDSVQHFASAMDKTPEEVTEALLRSQRLRVPNTAHYVSAVGGARGIARLTIRHQPQCPAEGSAVLLRDVLLGRQNPWPPAGPPAGHLCAQPGRLTVVTGSGRAGLPSALLLDISMLLTRCERDVILVDTHGELDEQRVRPGARDSLPARVVPQDSGAQAALMASLVQDHYPQVLVVGELLCVADVSEALRLAAMGIDIVTGSRAVSLEALAGGEPHMAPILGLDRREGLQWPVCTCVEALDWSTLRIHRDAAADLRKPPTQQSIQTRRVLDNGSMVLKLARPPVPRVQVVPDAL